MKTIIYIFICFFIISGLNAQDQAEISTKIRKVTLFPDRAQVYHDGLVDIPAGKTVLKVRGLSPKLISGTIQVKGDGDFMIMAVNQQMNYLEMPEESSNVKELRSRIDELQIKIEDENTFIGVLMEKEAFLVTNRLITGGNSSISSSEFKILTEQYVSGIESVRLGIQLRSRVVKVLLTEKQNLENQVAGVINRNSMPSAEVFITVLSNKSIKAKISLNYLVANAGWYPSYDIRVGSTDSPVEIFYKANAYQNTGVDWDNVLLSFSSASPSASGIMPILNPWFINFQQSIAIRGMSSRAAPQASRMKSLAEVEVLEDSEMGYMAPPVSISTSGTNFSFDLDIAQNIPSTGEETLIELQRLSANSSYKYMSIPKLRKEVFLTTGIPDWESLNLLDGKANIYFGNVFTGETYISRSQTDDTLSISLGKDEGITVKRELRTDFTSKRTLGSNRHDTRSFLLTIRNNRNNSINVDLFDQIPISRNNQITVDAEEFSGGTFNPVSGEVKWSLNLKPNESREFVLTYTVKFPKNQRVILE
jgi:uncharacterized protein (TIGR02231 family)